MQIFDTEEPDSHFGIHCIPYKNKFQFLSGVSYCSFSNPLFIQLANYMSAVLQLALIISDKPL